MPRRAIPEAQRGDCKAHFGSLPGGKGMLACEWESAASKWLSDGWVNYQWITQKQGNGEGGKLLHPREQTEVFFEEI